MHSFQPIRIALSVLFITAGLASPAAAQIGSLPGQNELQRALGQALDAAICPAVGGRGTGAQADLDDVCNFLQAEAGELSTNPGGVSNGGFTVQSFNEALDSIAYRQIPSIGKQVSEVAALQAGVISDRLFALREGTPGLQFAGVLIDEQGNAMPVDYAWFAGDAAAGDGGSWIPGLGVYANLEGGFGDRNDNVNEAGFDFRSVGFTLGTDYRVADPLVLGVAFTYGNTKRDFDNNGGEIESNSYTASLYGSFNWQDAYVDAVLSLGGKTIDTDRIIRFPGVSRSARGETDAFEIAFAGTAGYQFHLDALTFGPVLRGEYRELDIDGFSESGAGGFNLAYGDDDIESATLAVGGEILYAISTDLGVVTPQLGIEWEHQFADDRRNITTRVIADPSNTQLFIRTSSPDRNYANLSAGVSAALQGGVSAFFNYETLLAHELIDSHLFKIGVRGEF